MAVIDIRLWKRLFTFSIISRCILFAIQLISNFVLEDHDADAYKSPQYRRLQDVFSPIGGHSMSDNSSGYFREQLASDQYVKWSYWLTSGLTKWDGQYMINISMFGYTREQLLAFFPLYPFIITVIRGCIIVESPYKSADNLQQELDSLIVYLLSGTIGVIVNNLVIFPLATVALFKLTMVVKNDRQFAFSAVKWFCYNPASVFFSACYTESLFAMLTFSAMYFIEHKNNLRKNQDKNNLIDLTSPSSRLVDICWPAIPLISLGTATRSNGLINLMFISYHFIMPYVCADRTNWIYLDYIQTSMGFLLASILFLFYFILGALGFIAYQLRSYQKFCIASQEKSKPAWCSNRVPLSYNHVQSKYWDVGLFKYYQIKQLPNFIVASPMAILVLYGTNKYTETVRRYQKELTKITSIDKRNKVKAANRKANNTLFIYYAQVILLLIFCSFVINVQVTTRLLASSCPVIYWICADIEKKSPTISKLIQIYFITYFILGTILHCNFYPWT